MDRPLLAPITYLSFWDVELENLPAGTFTKRVLPMAEARGMLSAARASKTLICVSRKDLGAPYETRARERHDELCQVLREHAEIEMRLSDFFGDHCVNPSCLAEVTAQSRLLVVDCNYSLDSDRSSGESGEPERAADGQAEHHRWGPFKMRLSASSLEFHLFEHIAGP